MLIASNPASKPKNTLFFFITNPPCGFQPHAVFPASSFIYLIAQPVGGAFHLTILKGIFFVKWC
jgi:hypothetical protein